LGEIQTPRLPSGCAHVVDHAMLGFATFHQDELADERSLSVIRKRSRQVRSKWNVSDARYQKMPDDNILSEK